MFCTQEIYFLCSKLVFKESTHMTIPIFFYYICATGRPMEIMHQRLTWECRNSLPFGLALKPLLHFFISIYNLLWTSMTFKLTLKFKRSDSQNLINFCVNLCKFWVTGLYLVHFVLHLLHLINYITN